MGFLDNAPADFELHDAAAAMSELVAQLDGVSTDELVTTQLAQLGLAPAADLQTFTRELREQLNARVDELYGAAFAQRPKRMSGEHELPPSKAEVAGELQTLAAMHDQLTTVGKVFTDTAKSVQTIAADVLMETLPGERADAIERAGGSASLTVGDPRGNVRVSVTQPRVTVVDQDKLMGVMLDALVQAYTSSLDADEHAQVSVEVYALGARDAIAQLLQLISPPSWKITALDLYRTHLEAAGLGELAQQLQQAYGRKPKGKPQTKIERVADEVEQQ